MIKSVEEKPKVSNLEIDLTGPKGNAFYLLGLAKELSIALDLDWDNVHTKLTSGDYENLIKTFEKYFGDFVVLYR